METVKNKRILADVTDELHTVIKMKCAEKKYNLNEVILLGVNEVLDLGLTAGELGINGTTWRDYQKNKGD